MQKSNNFLSKDNSINSGQFDIRSIEYEESLLDLLPEANPIPPKVHMEDSKQIKIAFNYKLLDSPTFLGLNQENSTLSQWTCKKNQMSLIQCMQTNIQDGASTESGSSAGCNYNPVRAYSNDYTFITISDVFNKKNIIYDRSNCSKSACQNNNYKEIIEDSPVIAGEIQAEATILEKASEPPCSTQIGRILRFESRFESGNLEKASLVQTPSLPMSCNACCDEYNLLMQNDVNTKGFTQWFYFRVENTAKSTKAKFNIINFYKSNSLFNEGMKVLVYSQKKNTFLNLGWHRDCENIHYFRSNVAKVTQQGCFYYALSFEYSFEHDDDVIYFAGSQPYTYTDLCTYLDNVASDPKNDKILMRKLLCHTLAGNRVELLTITNSCKSPEEMKGRKGIVFTARVHPGETVSSWVMKGVLDFLLSEKPMAVLMRQHFIMKIVPMLNPDGVIHGNYRCSLAGRDLNRMWEYPSEAWHPEIFYTKKMIQQFSVNNNDVCFYCDLHGHSRKKGTFMYGCNDELRPFASREFPFIMSKVTPVFSFNDCQFQMQKSRLGTARIAVFREFGLINTYTLETSLCGPKDLNVHFSISDLEALGQSICQALLINFPPPQPPLTMMNATTKPALITNKAKFNNKKPVDKNTTTSIIASTATTTLEHFQIRNTQQKGSHGLKSVEYTEDLLATNFQLNNLDKTSMLKDLYANKQHLLNHNKDSSGSDSCPSVDNLSDNELAAILPSKNLKGKKLFQKYKNRFIFKFEGGASYNNNGNNTLLKQLKATGQKSLMDSSEKNGKASRQSGGKTSSKPNRSIYNFISRQEKCSNSNFSKSKMQQQQLQQNGKEKEYKLSILEPTFINFPVKLKQTALITNFDRYKRIGKILDNLFNKTGQKKTPSFSEKDQLNGQNTEKMKNVQALTDLQNINIQATNNNLRKRKQQQQQQQASQPRSEVQQAEPIQYNIMNTSDEIYNFSISQQANQLNQSQFTKHQLLQKPPPNAVSTGGSTSGSKANLNSNFINNNIYSNSNIQQQFEKVKRRIVNQRTRNCRGDNRNGHNFALKCRLNQTFYDKHQSDTNNQMILSNESSFMVADDSNYNNSCCQQQQLGRRNNSFQLNFSNNNKGATFGSDSRLAKLKSQDLYYYVQTQQQIHRMIKDQSKRDSQQQDNEEVYKRLTALKSHSIQRPKDFSHTNQKLFKIVMDNKEFLNTFYKQ